MGQTNTNNKDVAISSGLSQLSPEIRRILDVLRAEALVPQTVLQHELDAYSERLLLQAQHSEFFDLETAQKTASLCGHLLAALPEGASDSEHRLTQLAVNYFVLEEDAEDDNESLIGFDDDLQVVVAVIEELGLNHLLDGEPDDG